MPSANDVRTGQALSLDRGLFQIVEHNHTKPGKGKAFVKMKLRNLDGGGIVERTFRPDEYVERAIIDRREHQFLYKDDMGFHFMDNETYGQIAIQAEDVAEAADYLREGMPALLPMYEGRPIAVDLPPSVELTVTEAEPGVKGDRVSGATKPVTLETGLVIQVPLFVEAGDVLKVDTRTGEYMTRVT
ncbi:MAG: elongation factor P [Acidimicrobiia bacterium]|nr:elongation factor P [Acidimicrobiia bacterium]